MTQDAGHHGYAGRRLVRHVVAVIAALATMSVATGVGWTLLALRLEYAGYESGWIGFSSAAHALAFLVAPVVVGRGTHALGTLRLILACMAMIVACMVLFPLIETYIAWFVLRFVLGLSSTIVFIVADSWIAHVAPDRLRGRIIGLHGAILSAGFGGGPLLIDLVGSAGARPFLAAALIIVAAMAPLALVRGDAPAFAGHGASSLPAMIRRLPEIMVAGLLFGLVDSLSLSLLPIWGLHSGLDEGRVVAMVSVMILGSVVFQLPLGWLCDHVDRAFVLRACAAVLLATTLALPFLLADRLALYTVIACHGGALSGLYTVALVRMGQEVKGSDLVTANAAYTVLFGVGSLVGAPMGGVLMDAWDPHGLIVALSGACAGYLFFSLLRWRVRSA